MCKEEEYYYLAKNLLYETPPFETQNLLNISQSYSTETVDPPECLNISMERASVSDKGENFDTEDENDILFKNEIGSQQSELSSINGSYLGTDGGELFVNYFIITSLLAFVFRIR